MASGPIIISAADLHIDSEAVGGWDSENNRHSAWTESFRQFAKLIDLCNDLKADYLLVNGDTFMTGRPKAHAVALLTQELGRLTHTKAIFLEGNHDQQTVVGDHSTPIAAYLGEHKNVIKVASSPELFEHEGVEFALLPWTRVAGSARLDEANVNVHQAIQHLGDQVKGGGPVIFGSHIVTEECTFDSGRRGSEVSMTTAVLEATVPTSLIDEGPWSIARLGHIHKRQQLSDKTGYVGSIYKTTFGEVNDDKGVDIIRFDGKNKPKLEFHRFDVRELIKAELTEASGIHPQVIADQASPGDIVWLVLDADGEPKGFQGALKELKSKGITPRITRHSKERLVGGLRLAGLKVDTDPVEAFKVYGNQQGLDPQRAERLLKRFGDVVSIAHGEHSH